MSACMTLRLERPYLHLPIKSGAPKRWLRFRVGARMVREFDIELAEAETDYWVYCDVSEFNSQLMAIEAVDLAPDSRALDAIRQAAAVPDPDGTYREGHRPQFHFTARRGWLNDPNGLVFYQGEYHLFFQHNPYATDWGNMTWGHAVSRDLVHWQQLKNALHPDELGTMYTGSAVVDWQNTAGFQQGEEKALVIIYTAAGGASPQSAGQPYTQCLAYSNDHGRTWTKYEGNLVLPHVVGENRDPKVVWYAPARRWIMTLYLEGNDFGFFASPDLKTWTHLHDITVPGCREVPDFLELPVEGDAGDTRWVWTAANGHHLLGRFDVRFFVAESGPHQVDWGDGYYAVQTYSDIPPADGRRIQIAWMRHGQYPGMPFSQQMSFPCTLSLRNTWQGLRLCRQPVREIERLHARQHIWTEQALVPGENPLQGLQGELFQVRAEFELGGAEEVGFRLRGEAVSFRVQERKLSCLGHSVELVPLDARIRLEILLDRKSIEVFANDGAVSMTSCFAPKPESQTLQVYGEGGPSQIAVLEVWELRSAWDLQ